MLLILPIFAILLPAALIMVMGKPRFLREIPQPQKHAETPPSISIIVPARNEEDNIPKLLESFHSEKQFIHETIIVDDESTDATKSLSEQGGAKVITSEPLPEDWKGKPWACLQGAVAAEGEWLLFLDSDVRLHPGAMRKITDLIENGDTNTAYSIYPYHAIEKPYEELSAYFNSLMVAGVGAFGCFELDGRDPALFGQCLLIPKRLYLLIDGHAAVKDKVLENFHLAKHLKEAHGRCLCYLGEGLISMRMFPKGYKELWNSWKKGFASGAAHTDINALIFSSAWVAGGMFSVISMLIGLTPLGTPAFVIFTIMSYVSNVIAAYWAFQIAGRFSMWNAALFPISLLFYQVLFAKSVIDRKKGIKTTWKGRPVD
ncbi:4,4'-diaponeurosporenoate glycosyltransferase [Rubritalea squalenifaciens DSM 18772]|uniref:4,4'-diaponeurosporenoate glycosyltransferase n=1 Tax=Rubritalea squalenifaciens DSM 18772 TaxID=1123071 RepID=A0A1M6STH2_9BACT|nr:glycosyltransferase [Rubritalea squalenifaciens]SHK47868.1 4,4'-diaponeurosporenoate glycosyltransferase [Rubritalea squalenifaciens DSM 18772]